MAYEGIDPSVRIKDSEIPDDVMIREFCTIRNSSFGPGCSVYERSSIKKSTIGTESAINTGCYLENVDVGSNVQIAPLCSVVGVTHEFDETGINHTDVFQRITIKDGAWLGTMCIILPGVTIGKGAVIGAGAVVSKNVPDHHVYVGTPLHYKLYSYVK